MTGTLKDIFYDFSERETSVLLKIEGNVHDELKPLVGQRIIADIKKWRKRRSLDANNYYWELVGKLARHFDLDNIQMHSTMLRRYSEPWFNEDGELQTWFVPDKVDIDHFRDMHFGIMETGIRLQGTNYIKVYLLLPSHLMDSKQMSRLIDGVVSECKAAGIETIPPEELERMLSMWRPNEKKRSS